MARNLKASSKKEATILSLLASAKGSTNPSLSTFLARGKGLSHRTLQNSESHGSSRVADDDGQLMGTTSSDIEIEFMEVSEMGVGNSASAKDKLPLVQETGSPNGVRARGLERKNSAKERQTTTNRETNLGKDERGVTLSKEVEGVKPIHRAPQHVLPIFRSMNKINEESDAFIRTRKEAMETSYNIESKTY
ncbi:hypothetical protein Ancab_019422 [Ancistrocladus abbreviatus]